MSEQHRPNDDLERKRIQEAGGIVSYSHNAWRINGEIGVARSFGKIN